MEITATDSALVARVTHLSKHYGSEQHRVTALDDVSIGIRGGEFTAIMGPSGSGKSTLMHVLAGLDTASAGQVWLGNDEITHLGDAELTRLRRQRIGFVFQAFNLVPTLDVVGNIMLPFELDGRVADAHEQLRISALITALGLGERLKHRPSELSGGQQQRVAIARALATRPDVIFADEPTGALDSRTSRDVLQLLRSAATGTLDSALGGVPQQHTQGSERGVGQSIVMVTHDPTAASYADRILFLADGRIIADRGPMTAAEVSAAMLQLEDAVA